MEVTVQAGEALYLPASWFHCVTSIPDVDNKGESYHLAVNYWYHPPDQQDFELPYKDDFWARNKESRSRSKLAG
jgi:oxalate decarboxylase/phosphoglucose isomerase-like protein (cupin superfamily)